MASTRSRSKTTRDGEPTIVDLMAATLVAEKRVCQTRWTRFCAKRASACPDGTSQPTCCKETYDLDCVGSNCNESDTLITSLRLSQSLLVATLAESGMPARAIKKLTAGGKRRSAKPKKAAKPARR